MKISNSNTINRKDLWVLLVRSRGFIIAQFVPKPFLQVRICGAQRYKLLSFISSCCVVGSELAGITCFYKEVYPRQGGGGKFIPWRSH
jgi:hypothetical protein